MIAFAAITDSSRTLALIDADGARRRTLRTDTPTASAPSWSPDGTTIAFSVRY
jgi:Tol biopolymer transport system component